MKKRPLSIRILAILFLLSPLGLVAQIVYFYRIPPAKLHLVFHPAIWTVQATVFAVLTPLVGYCVWTVHKWAYVALMGFLGLVVVNNVVVALSGNGLWDATATFVLGGGLAALVAVAVRREFVAPYFNPRLRWWENAHRYVTDRIRIAVRACGSGEAGFEAKSFDISKTGIYIATDRAVPLGTCMEMDVLFPNGESARVSGEVVWIHGGSDRNPPGFGCRFVAPSRHFKAEIARAVRELHAAMQDR